MSLDNFYVEAKEMMAEETTLSDVEKTVVFFRVAVEYGATYLGMDRLTYLMSRLLMETLGIATGDPAAGYEDVIDDFDSEDETKH
jgi:hypothetical protein